MSGYIDALQSFVPRVVIEGEHSGRAESIQAAVLVADVTGSAALATSLSSRGTRAAEATMDVLNDYFEAVLGAIQSHGGDALKFAGDAVFAIWPAREGELAEEGAMAAACALAAAEEVARVKHRYGVQLAQRVGVGAGQIRLFHAGQGSSQQFVVMAGTAFEEALEAQHAGEAGTVRISARLAGLLGTSALTTELPNGVFELTSVSTPPRRQKAPGPPLEPFRIEHFVPPPVRARLAAGLDGWMAERRRVSVLFLNIRGFDHTAADAGSRLEEILGLVQPVFDSTEGFVNQVLVDEKGVDILGLFGVPPQAHSDDALRALTAAHKILEELVGRGIDASLGVTTGSVLVGPLGSAWRREYTAIGEAVNLAARFMAQPGNQVLADEATQMAASTGFLFEQLQPIQVKGWVAPVPAARVVAPRLSGSRPVDAKGAERPTIYGRSEECQTFDSLVEGLARGRGGLAVLIGEAGIGKSSLVSWVLQSAEAAGHRTIAARGDPLRAQTPYGLWADALAAEFGLADQDAMTAVQRRQAIEAAVSIAPEVAELAPLLSGILGVEMRDTERTAKLEGEDRAGATKDLLVRMLGSMNAVRPLVIALDDVQWADSASWEVIRSVAEQLPSALLLLSRRPFRGAAPAVALELEARSPVATINLGSLEGAYIERVAERVFAVDSLPPALAQFFRESAGGNPFYAEELAISLLSRGVVRVEDRRCLVVSPLDSEVPNSVDGVVTSRIDQLEPNTQLAMKVASVFGDSFTATGVLGAFPIAVDEAAVARELRRLEALDLIRSDPASVPGSYTFKHAITQQVAYDLMPDPQRREIHRRAAEYEEQLWLRGGESPSRIDVLAHHWIEASEGARAMPYLEQAASRAARDGAYLEAARAYERILTLNEELAGQGDRASASPAVRARWLEGLGRSYFDLNRWDEANTAFVAALKALGRSPVVRRPSLAVDIGTEITRQLAWTTRGRRLPETVDEDALRAARIYFLMGQQAFGSEQSPLVVASYALRSLAEAQKSSASPELARGLAGLCVGMTGVGRQKLASFYAGLAEDANDLLPESDKVADTGLGFHYLTVGKWPEAIAHARRASEYYRSLGHGRMLFDSTGVLIQSLWRSGDLVASLETARYHRSLSRAEPALACWGSAFIAVGLLSISGPADALAWADDSVAQGEAAGAFPAYLFTGRAVRAKTLALLGRLHEALDGATKAEAELEVEIDSDGLAFQTLAEAYHAITQNKRQAGGPTAEELQRATDGAVRMRQDLERMVRAAPIWRPAVLRLLAYELQAANSNNKAIEMLKDSSIAARNLRMPHERALSLAAFSRLAADTATAATARERAIQLLEKVGATYDRSQLE